MTVENTAGWRRFLDVRTKNRTPTFHPVGGHFQWEMSAKVPVVILY
jgi:hypothetical protein